MVSGIKCALHDYSLFHKFRQYAVIFLPARPGSQTHASHKGRMILNHESPAGCIKIVAKSLHLVFATFVLSLFFLTCASCPELDWFPTLIKLHFRYAYDVW